jgi:hypothetical protein
MVQVLWSSRRLPHIAVSDFDRAGDPLRGDDDTPNRGSVLPRPLDP